MELRRHEPGPQRPSAPPDISSLWERLEEGANVPLSVQNIPRISGCERDHVPEAAVGRAGRARGTPVPVRGGAAGAADPAATAAAASGRRAGRGQPTAPTAAAATTTAATAAAAARTAGTMMIQRDTASNSVTQQD